MGTVLLKFRSLQGVSANKERKSGRKRTKPTHQVSHAYKRTSTPLALIFSLPFKKYTKRKHPREREREKKIILREKERERSSKEGRRRSKKRASKTLVHTKVKNHKLLFWSQTIKESRPSNVALRYKAQTRKLGIKSKLSRLLDFILVLDLLDITMNVFCGDML